METLYVWLVGFAGATIMVLGMFLLSSERELKKQRREFDQPPKNKDLVEKISSLSSQLDESKRTVEQLQGEQQHLLDELQTSESLVSTTTSQYKEAADRNLQIESELAESRQQMDKLMMRNNELMEMANSLSSKLAARERTVEELQGMQDRLPAIESDNRQLRSANQELQEEMANVRKQLGTTESRFGEALTQGREIAEHNSKLQTEVSELNHQVRASQEIIKELEAEHQRLGGVNFENQQLREEIATLRNQLQTSETQLSESAWKNQEVAGLCSRLQNEVAELKQQAEKGQAKARELEAMQEHLGKVESREMILIDQQHNLEAQIADLQRERLTGKEKVQELDATHKRLAEMEHVCQQLREENRRLEEEISRSQERLAESEAIQRQVSTLRQQLEELQTQQAAVAQANCLINRAGENSDNHIDLSSDESAARIQLANTDEIKPAVRTSKKQKWRSGIIPATGAIAIAAAVAVGFLNTSSDKHSGSKAAVVASETASIEQSVPIETASKTLKRPSPVSGENEFSNQIRRRVQGTFEITRPTQVYSGPSDTSPRIANIEPGMKINVVDSRDGWLEIRSKHGRPSGFVRQAAAVRIDQNR
jgi:chromosome segregation ATPase